MHTSIARILLVSASAVLAMPSYPFASGMRRAVRGHTFSIWACVEIRLVTIPSVATEVYYAWRRHHMGLEFVSRPATILPAGSD